MIPAIATETLGHLAAQAGIGGISGDINSWLNPNVAARKAADEQVEWFKYPSNIPGIAELLKLDQQGWFDLGVNGSTPRLNRQDFGMLMRMNGVSTRIPPSGVGGAEYFIRNNNVWNMIRDAMKIRPGISEAFQGLISGALTRDQFDLMMLRNGANSKDWDWILPFVCQRITPDQAIMIWRRGLMNKDELVRTLKFLQYGVEDDIEDFMSLAFDIPGPQDIIRYAVREAFNPEQVKLLGLDLELDQNPDYLDWAKASGLGTVDIVTFDGKEKSVDFAKLEWYAHWQLPSPGQVYDFFHKFYGDSQYGPSPYLKYAKPFEAKEMNALLKANDYSPAFRSHLAGAAFLPYTRIDVRRIRQAGLISEGDVYHNYRASGYDDEHAKALTKWVEKDLKDKTTNLVKTGIKGELCKAYTTGIITNQDMQARLIDVGYTADEAKAHTGLCDMKAGNAYAKEAVTTIKRNYLTGGFDEQEATTALKKYSFTDIDIQRYLAIWNLKLDGTVRQTSTQMVTGWFIEGIIGLEEYISRLSKMNYTPQDVTRIVQAAQYEQAKRLARAQKVAASEAQKQIEKNLRDADKARKEAEAMARQRQRELQRLQAAMQKEEADRFRRFLAGRTEANLRNWLSDGSISEDEVRYTFNARGWNPVDIERWLQVEREKGQ